MPIYQSQHFPLILCIIYNEDYLVLLFALLLLHITVVIFLTVMVQKTIIAVFIFHYYNMQYNML